jgi:hypothetical protein
LRFCLLILCKGAVRPNDTERQATVVVDAFADLKRLKHGTTPGLKAQEGKGD